MRRFGYQTDTASSSELAELLRASLESADPSVLWTAREEPTDDSVTIGTGSAGRLNKERGGDLNPYLPPSSEPQRSDWRSDSFLFSAVAPCDATNLDWSAATYAKQSDVFALVIMIMFISVGLLAFLFEETIEPWLAGGRGMILSVVTVLLLPLLGKVLIRPYKNLLRRRCADEPLFAEESFRIQIRLHTLSAWNDAQVATWPSSQVRSVQSGAHLIVLRVAPRRQLYITGTSQTTPEAFATFRKGVGRRLRRTRWQKLLRRERSRSGDTV
ncbi:MAG: hypothetical protein ACR2NZ_21560 [Rubripirellula sp.]